ncbi:MAG: HPr(Ser) kinase/phosphatase [Oscillospiraceae bacterium]
MAQFSVSLDKIVNQLNLEVVYKPDELGNISIVTADVNRPGLLLTGYDEYFDPTRLQILGMAEMGYLETLEESERRSHSHTLFATKPPAVIITRNLAVFDEMLEFAGQYKVPVLRTSENTSALMSALISMLSVELAQRITRHGVLVEVYGEGILILGESGVGKSETAVELVKRGHRLIADDAVELRRVSNRTILGTAPENIRHFIELRGVGIINVARVFGSGAVKMSEKIDLVVELEPWDRTKNYSRTGLEQDTTEILGIDLPCTVIPVMPGRNLAVILETAAINNRQKKMGYNAAKELLQKLGLENDVEIK